MPALALVRSARARRPPPPVPQAPLVIHWAPIPDTAQESFFDDDTPEANILFEGGWSAGKTMTLVGKTLKLSARNAPHPGIWIVPRYDHIHRTILPKLRAEDAGGRRWFLADDQFHYHETKHELQWIGGGPIWLVSADDPRAIAGPDVCFAAVDEPGSIKFDAWRNTIARVRHARARLRQKIATGTPEGLSWLADWFGPEGSSYNRRYRMGTAENTELANREEFIAQIRAGATEAEVATYLEGKTVNLKGAQAYPTFDREAHWLEDVPLDPDAPLRVSFDFNVDPMACVIGQIGVGLHGPELRVIDAIVKAASWTPEICAILITRYGRTACLRAGIGAQGWPGGLVVYGDATGNDRSTTSLRTNYDYIRELLAPEFPAGFAIHASALSKRNPPEADRLNAVNVLLRDAHGRRRCVIRKTLPTAGCATAPLVRSLELSTIAPGTNALHKPSGETLSHASDALGYLVAAEFSVRRPQVLSAVDLFGGGGT